jgi:transcriptional regulator with XRE-family HTH domain
MNGVLGARIRSLRESKGITQEQMAEKMSCTRQKYARIEKGLTDISYVNISTIAIILAVKTEDITSALQEVKIEQPVFRGTASNDNYELVNQMIDTFYSHRKLYNSVRQVDIDE